MTRALRVALLASLGSFAACGGGGGGGNDAAPGPPKSSTATSPDAAPKPFVDATAASNIVFVVGFTRTIFDDPVAEATFGGAAAGDCDGDGDVDLFITYGDRGPNRLYINQLNRGSGVPLQFQDTAALAGVAYTREDGRGNDRHSGPTFADLDGDGDLDLFLGGIFSDPNKLYANRGDCTFEDVTQGSGIEGLFTDHTLSAAFGDYDLDGDLDLFLTHWQSIDKFEDDGESEHLFRNVSGSGGIHFENVSASSGVTGHLLDMRSYTPQRPYIDWTFTPTFARINDDLWPDIAIAADFKTSQLLLNDLAGSGGFVDATNADLHSIQYGMGSALGDIDFDGDLDWFVSAVYLKADEGDSVYDGNFLLENPGGDFAADQYQDITGVAGVADGRWGWGACFLDIDNDTDLDIYHTNGWEATFRAAEFFADPSRVFVSDGAGAFAEQAFALGLNDTNSARGVVCADFDNDGDVDILQVTNLERNSATLWKNDSAAASNNFLRVRLVGAPPNTEAAGARIFATIGTRTQMREIMVGGSYTSQNPTVQIFGLGTATAVDELRVEWPALLPGPSQPAEWVGTIIPAGIRGQTLVICHPDLTPVPDNCAEP